MTWLNNEFLTIIELLEKNIYHFPVFFLNIYQNGITLISKLVLLFLKKEKHVF